MGHRVVHSITFAIVLQASMLSGLFTRQSPPRIIKQPQTDELLFEVNQDELHAVDKPLYIECEAEGEPAPEYRWTKNGEHFEWQAYDNRISVQPGRGSFVISAPRDEDSGYYQCIAENSRGTAISNSVSVRKAELNSFNDEGPVTLNANEGDPFKLTCQPPDGWPKPKVYWMIEDTHGRIKSINNSRITLDPEGNLWFSNVTKNDASNDSCYACAATSVFRNEHKLGNRVFLNVVSTGASASKNKHEPVQQYVSKENEVALLGKNTEFHCIFGGTPLPQIAWKKNGQVINSNNRITQGNHGKSLIIKQVSFEDEGSYTCEATNGIGNAKSYSINLQVLAVPYFTVEPETKNAAEDETVEFRCEASGVPEPQIRWIHNGKPIEEAPPNPRRRVSANSIVIENLWKNDTGNYGCNATNSLGYVYKDVYVNVLAVPPEITQPPTNEATVVGKTIRITCRVFGAPKPGVKWLRNGQELTGARYKTLPSGDLEIENVFFPDAGTYKCYASNKFGDAEASGELEVKQRTIITDEPEDYEVAAGSMATFRCNAVTDSSLDLTMIWLSNGEEIDFESEPKFVRSTDNSLTIMQTTARDSGTYTCVARTELDEARAQAKLTVLDVPYPPRIVELTCQGETAIVGWENPPANWASRRIYTIQFNTSFAPDKWETVQDDFMGTLYNVPLSPGVSYTFRVLAANKIGSSRPSPHSEVCTTPPDVPYKNPENVRGKGTNPHNIVISWKVMPRIEHSAPRLMYRVFYKRDIPGEEWITKDINNWRRHKLEVNNQPTYQRYKIKVLAINEKGVSRVSPNEVIGWSGEDVPQQAPDNFTLLRVQDSTSALFAWNPVPEESVRGDLKGYKIQTWTDDGGEENMREIRVRKHKTQVRVKNFLPYSKNYVRILAYNGRYNGPASEILSFETPEGVPGMVQGLDGFPLGSTALYLVWRKPERANGNLTGYNIYYQSIDGTQVGMSRERVPHITDPEVTKVKLARLEPDTVYRIRVVARTKIGEGDDNYIELTTQTAVAFPPAVPRFSWESIPTEDGLVTIKVTWLPSQDGNPGSHFFVKYKLKGSVVGYQTVPEINEDFTKIQGLRRGEIYVMTIVAVDGIHSTESLPQEVDTTGNGQ